jgi:hypothetical protein
MCDDVALPPLLPFLLRVCRTFLEQLKAAGDRLLRTPPAPPADLSPPAQVRCLFQISELSVAMIMQHML